MILDSGVQYLSDWRSSAEGHRGSPTNRLSVLTDDHLSEMLAVFVITVGCLGVLEREYAIDDWLEPVHGDG